MPLDERARAVESFQGGAGGTMTANPVEGGDEDERDGVSTSSDDTSLG